MQTGPVDLTGRTLTDLAAQLRQGHLSSRQITQWYLDRIAALDRQGPKIQAVIAVNPQALVEAGLLDDERRAGHVRGALHGLPILVKDNIETRDQLPTTAGSLALADNMSLRDAAVVARLRAAGAIVLGKANLSEWANFRGSRAVSGWSGVGGADAQSLRARPIRLRIEQRERGGDCGEHGGGRDRQRNGRIGDLPGQRQWRRRAEADAGAGMSRTHIVPIAHSQDTAGPLGHSVSDVAVLLTVMGGR
ncbi:MAG: amidase family protein [Rhodospirillales bacterium]